MIVWSLVINCVGMSRKSTSREQLAVGVALHRLGKLREAEEQYLAVLERDPAHAEASRLLSVIALERGELELAADRASAALAVRPESGEYLHLLGRIRLRQGNLQDALRYLSRAVNCKPPELEQALLDLSACLGKLKAWPQSLAFAREASELNPRAEVAHRLAGHACFALDRHPEAIEHFERVLAGDPTQHSLWHLVSVSLCRIGRPGAAYEHSTRACALVPENTEYAQQRRLAASAAIPDWHFNMVNDEARNAAFASAIDATVKPGQRVLEIGTGSGLLAMLAARAAGSEAGAAVVTCEANPLLARAATKIVEANGLSSSIVVVPKASSDLRVGVELPARADVLICEIFSVQVIAEGVLPTVEDAKSRLLAPDATVIPRAASARAALVGGEALARRTRVATVSGFDLTPLNEFTPAVQYLSPEQELELLSAPVDLLRFDLQNSQRFPAEKRTVSIVAAENGLCQGVVQWLLLELCSGVSFENRPGTPEAVNSRHWHPVFYPFAEPVSVAAGQTVTVRASHNRSGMHVTLLEVA